MLIENMATRGKQRRRSSKNSSKTPLLNSDFEEPPKKKTKLVNSSLSLGEKVVKGQTAFVKVILNDALSLVHTSLCDSSCTFTHHPLVLSLGVKPDHRLKKCLENYLKLAVKNGWTSQTAPYDSCLSAGYPLVHLAVLFGKLQLLEFLLNSNSESCEYLDSDGNSPLHTALNNLNNFAPISVWEDKAEIFQQIVGLLAKYNSHVLRVRDGIFGDSILHLCAKKIRDLSVKIKSNVSSSHETTSNSDLQTQRLLYARCFKIMVETFQSLCTEETLRENDVGIVFDSKNNAGETILNILEDDELTRELKRFSCVGEVSAADITEGAGNCDSFKETQEHVQQQNSSTVVGEEKNSCEPSACTEQQAGKPVDKQLDDASETGMLVEQTDGNYLTEMLEYGYNNITVKESLQCTLVGTSKFDNQHGENPHVLIDQLDCKEKNASISPVKSSQLGRQSIIGDNCDDLVKSYQLNQEQILEDHTSNSSVKTVKTNVEEEQTVHVAVVGESLQTERQKMRCETHDLANKSSHCQVKPAEGIFDSTSVDSSSESAILGTARCVPVEDVSETESQWIKSEKIERHGNKSKFHKNETTAIFMGSDTSEIKSKTVLPQKRKDSCTCVHKSPEKARLQESVWESFERPKKPLGDEHEKEAKEQEKVYLLLRETESDSQEDCIREKAKTTEWDSSQEPKECDDLQNDTTICVIKEESLQEEGQVGKGSVGLFEQSPQKEQTIKTNIDMTEEPETIGLMQRGTPNSGGDEQTPGIARQEEAKEKCESQERQLECHDNQIGMSDSGCHKEQIQTDLLQEGAMNCVEYGSLEGSVVTDLPLEESPDIETQNALMKNFESMVKLVDIKAKITRSCNSSDDLAKTDVEQESPGNETQEVKGKTSGPLEMSSTFSYDQPRGTGCDSSVEPLETGAQRRTVNSASFEASLNSEKRVDSEPLKGPSGSNDDGTKVLKCDSLEEPMKISVQRGTITWNIASVEESAKGEIHVESISQEGSSGCNNDQTNKIECGASEEPVETRLQQETVKSAIVEESPKNEMHVDSEPLKGLSGSSNDQTKILQCGESEEPMEETVNSTLVEESQKSEKHVDSEPLKCLSGSSNDQSRILECGASEEPMETRLKEETVKSAMVEESQKSEIHVDSEPPKCFSENSNNQTKILDCGASEKPMESHLQKETVYSAMVEESQKSEIHVDSEPLKCLSGSSNDQTKILECGASGKPMESHLQKETVYSAMVEESQKSEIHVDSEPLKCLSGSSNDQTKLLECGESEKPMENRLQKETVYSAMVEESQKSEIHVDSEPLKCLSGSSNDQTEILECGASEKPMESHLQTETVYSAMIEESQKSEIHVDSEPLKCLSGSSNDQTKLLECGESEEPMESHLQKETVYSTMVEESQKSEIHVDSEPLKCLSGSSNDETKILECGESEELLETRLQKETVYSAMVQESPKSEEDVDSEPLKCLSGSSNNHAKILEFGASEEPMETRLQEETVNSAMVEESQKSEIHVDSEPLKCLSGSSNDQTKISECGASEKPMESHLQKETVYSAMVEESQKSEIHVDSEPLKCLSASSNDQTEILECGASEKPMESHLQKETVYSAMVEESQKSEIHVDSEPLKCLSGSSNDQTKISECGASEKPMESHLQKETVYSAMVEESQKSEIHVDSEPLKCLSASSNDQTEILECGASEKPMESHLQKETVYSAMVEESQKSEIHVDSEPLKCLSGSSNDQTKISECGASEKPMESHLQKETVYSAMVEESQKSEIHVDSEPLKCLSASSNDQTEILECGASEKPMESHLQKETVYSAMVEESQKSEIHVDSEPLKCLSGSSNDQAEILECGESEEPMETCLQKETVKSAMVEESQKSEIHVDSEPLKCLSGSSNDQTEILECGASEKPMESRLKKETVKSATVEESQKSEIHVDSEPLKCLSGSNNDQTKILDCGASEEPVETRRGETTRLEKNTSLKESEKTDALQKGRAVCVAVEESLNNVRQEVATETLTSSQGLLECNKGVTKISICDASSGLVKASEQMDEPFPNKKQDEYISERSPAEKLELIMGQASSSDDGSRNEEVRSVKEINATVETAVQDSGELAGNVNGKCLNVSLDAKTQELVSSGTMDTSLETEPNEIEKETCKPLRETSVDAGDQVAITQIGASLHCSKSTDKRNTDKDLEIRENFLEDRMEGNECTKYTEGRNTDKDLEIRDNSFEDGMEGSSQVRTINPDCTRKSYDTVEDQVIGPLMDSLEREIQGQDRAITLDFSEEFSDTTEKQNGDGNPGSMENSRQCERHGSGEERTISLESAQDSFHAIDKQKRDGNLGSTAISVNLEMQGCADMIITSIESVQKAPLHTEKGTENGAISSTSRNWLGLEIQASDQLKAANRDYAQEQFDSTRENNEDAQIRSSVSSLEFQVLDNDQVISANLESTQESSDITGEQKQDKSLGSSVISLEFEKQDKDEVSCANAKSAQGLAGQSKEEGQDRSLGCVVNSTEFETQSWVGSPRQARQCFEEVSGALYTSSRKSPKRGIHEMGKIHSEDLQHQSPRKRPRIGSTDFNMMLQPSGCVTQYEDDLQGGSSVETLNGNTRDAAGIQCDLLYCEVPQDTTVPNVGQGLTNESNTPAQSPPSSDPIVSIDMEKEHPRSEALTSDAVPVCFAADDGVNLLTEDLDRTRCPPLTLLVSRVKPQPKDVKLPKGIHPPSCSRYCIFTHHELVQLLCATPDYHSTEISEDENEACAKFREFLRNTAWNLDTIVPDPCYQLRRPVLHLACMLGKLKALVVLAEIGFNPLVRASYWETALHTTVRLLGYGSTAYLFLPQVFVNIVKTLRRHSTILSLLSAEDVTGNTVLHSLAYKVASERFSYVVFYYAFLFRISVSFLLSEHHETVGADEVIKLLESSNKAGRTVKQILETEVIGRQLMKSVTDLLESGTHVSQSSPNCETASDEAGLLGFKPFMSEKLNPSGCVSQGPSDGSDNLSNGHVNTQPVNGDPESLVDFILSKDFNITESTKDLIFQSFDDEYVDRIRRLNRKLIRLKRDWRDIYFLELKEEALQTQEAELKAMETNIGQSRTSETLAEQEIEQVCLQEREVSAKINLVDETIIALQEIEGSLNRMPELEMSR